MPSSRAEVRWRNASRCSGDGDSVLALEALVATEAGPFANYISYTHHTGRVLEKMAALQPKTLATMHGSTSHGNGETALRVGPVIGLCHRPAEPGGPHLDR